MDYIDQMRAKIERLWRQKFDSRRNFLRLVGPATAGTLLMSGKAAAQNFGGGPSNPTISVKSDGSVTNRALSTRFASPSVDVRDFTPSGTKFGTGSSQPLSNFFQTLSAAQLVYPFVTSLAQEMDGCAIQLALNTLYTAGGGEVLLPPCTAMINFQIVVNTSKVRLSGFHTLATSINAYECVTPVTFSGYISGTTLTVTSSPSSGTVKIGQSLTIPTTFSPQGYGPIYMTLTLVTALGTGRGGVGTYTVNQSQTVGSTNSPVTITGSVPAIHLSGSPTDPNYNYPTTVVLRDLSIISGYTLTAPTTPGSPATGYATGSSALLIDSMSVATIESVAISGFDQTTIFGSYLYILLFDKCSFNNNNKGICFNCPGSALAQIGENIRWRDCLSGNNNYGFWICGTANSNGSSSFAMDWIIDGSSIDYNWVQFGMYISSTTSYTLNSLTITDCHFETNFETSGDTNSPISLYGGSIAIKGGVVFWSDNNGPEFLLDSDSKTFTDYLTAPVVRDVRINGGGMAVCGQHTQSYSISGVYDKLGNLCPAQINSAGLYVCQIPEKINYSSNNGITVNNINGEYVNIGGGTITLPTNLNLAPGQSVRIRTGDTNPVTITQSTGLLIVGPGANATFGGTVGAFQVATIGQGQTWTLTPN